MSEAWKVEGAEAYIEHTADGNELIVKSSWFTFPPQPDSGEAWERFSLRLYGEEAGDYEDDAGNIGMILASAGLRIVDADGRDVLADVAI